LHTADLKKLGVFHHKGIRHVLNVSRRWKQATEHLTNYSLRKRLDGIAMIQETIEERRLDWLGTMARQPDYNLPKRLLTAWMKPRNNCGQKLTLRDSNVMTVNQMLEYNAIDKAPSNEYPSNSWIPLAKECDLWRMLVYKCQNDRL
jgi:hypothetical protein